MNKYCPKIGVLVEWVYKNTVNRGDEYEYTTNNVTNRED